MNSHAYVSGNPVSYADPMGLCPWCAVGLVVASTCYAVGKFIDSAITALDDGAKYNKMGQEMQNWMANGMKGEPPYTQSQLQDAQQKAISGAAQTGRDGAGLSTGPVRGTGSILRKL